MDQDGTKRALFRNLQCACANPPRLLLADMTKRALCSLSLLAKRAVRELALTLRLAKRAVCDPSLKAGSQSDASRCVALR